jgi:hypothetical protein
MKVATGRVPGRHRLAVCGEGGKGGSRDMAGAIEYEVAESTVS